MSRINRGREALKGKREVVEKERENAQKDLDAAEVNAGGEIYLTESVHRVVLQKSIPAQICQFIFYHY